MKRINTPKILFLIFLLCCISCAHTKPETREGKITALENAVQTLWTAKQNSEWGTVYDMTIAGYRQKIEREKFIARANVTVEKYEILSLEPDFDNGKAIAKVAYDMVIMGYRLTNKISEEWLLEDGYWKLNLLPSIEASPFSQN